MEKVEDDIKEMLMSQEEILFIARQSRVRPGGSLATPNSIYVTNRRLIWRNPKLLGLKKDYNTQEYQDISNIRLKKGIFSTQIILKARFLSQPLRLPSIDKKDAAQIGVYIQKGMRGELPNQIITEKKSEARYEPRMKEPEDPLEQLEKLGKLRDAGILTEDEFQRKKEEILQKI